MKKVYRLTIRPLTSFRTPLQSDTIFGHLMWALRYTEGEEALRDVLGRYRDGDLPLLVSAGFPAGTLPMPALTLEPGQSAAQADSTTDRVVRDMVSKALEEARYLPLTQWHELAHGLSARTLREKRDQARSALRDLKGEEKTHPVTRTAVDRITGSGRKGRLFVSQETFYAPDRRFDVWHKLDKGDEVLLERVMKWWRWVERNGFGGRKSAGHGAFRIEGEGLVEAAEDLPHVEKPNGFVTLSAWVPARDDPTDVHYRTRVKRGKLSEAYALPGPWKKPLLMLEPGAVARLEDGEPLREWYGRLVENIHWGEPAGIVQYGYAFPLPVVVEEVAS